MKRISVLLVAVGALACVVAGIAPPQVANDAAASIDAGKHPAGYRDWRLVSVAREEGR